MSTCVGHASRHLLNYVVKIESNNNRPYSKCLNGRFDSALTTLRPNLVPSLENPPDGRKAQADEQADHQQAAGQADIRHAKEAPPEAGNQINHWIEQCHVLPKWRQHRDRIKTTAQKHQRGNDQ